jgi:hypothetical protein
MTRCDHCQDTQKVDDFKRSAGTQKPCPQCNVNGCRECLGDLVIIRSIEDFSETTVFEFEAPCPSCCADVNACRECNGAKRVPKHTGFRLCSGCVCTICDGFGTVGDGRVKIPCECTSPAPQTPKKKKKKSRKAPGAPPRRKKKRRHRRDVIPPPVFPP